MPEAWCGVPQR